MTVEELIKSLKAFPPTWEVVITDGHKCNCYRGKYEILPFEDDDGTMVVDIGIGGLDE